MTFSKPFYAFLIAAVALSVSAASCDKTPGENDDPGNKTNDPSGKTDLTWTFTIGQSADKTAWVAGDKIYVHGEAVADNQVITLKAEDISSDGKSATVKLENAPGKACTPDDYYAAYPADAVGFTELNCYYYNRFAKTDSPMLSGYLDGTTFNMMSVSALLTFKVSGEFTFWEIKGNGGEELSFKTLQVKTTSKGNNFKYETSGASKEIKGNYSAGDITVSFPGGVYLSRGYTITFYNGSDAVKMYRVTNEVTLDAGTSKSLGDITSSLENVTELPPVVDPANSEDLSAKGTANCYMLSRPGTYKFKAVKGNSSESVGSLAKVDVLWETDANGIAEAGSIIARASVSNGYVNIATPETLKPGNALIAARNSAGTILWSWHIWVPATEVTSDKYGLSWYLMMSRNLGALEDASATSGPEAYGLLYQWGRKDPFPCVSATNLNGGTMTIAQSIANPTAFANNAGTWMSTVDATVWGDKATKTIYDPCPVGYKVPMREDVTALFSTDDLSSSKGWQYASGHSFAVGSPQVWFPYCGYLDASGNYTGAGSSAKIWNSHMDSANDQGYGIFLSGETSTRSSQKAAQGGTVRCISEEQVQFTNAPGMPVMGTYKRIVFDTNDVVELSGLHLSLDKTFLWGVGDEGYLYKFTNIDGDVSAITPSTVWTYSADMEGVTIDPSNGDLYLAIEPKRVYKVAGPNYNSKVTMFDVEEAANMGNSGMEGIAWHKGDLYVGSQSGATLWCYTLSGTKKWKKQLGTIAPGIIEVGDLFYDSLTDLLWVSDSEAFKLFVFDGDVTELKAIYDIKFIGNPESVCVDHGRNCVWLADDGSTSKIYRVEFSGL